MSEDKLPQDDSDISKSEDSRAVSENPIKWKLLPYYLRSLPTRIELTKDYESVEIQKNYNSNSHHKVLVNELHNLIVRAVSCDPSHNKTACEFLNKIIKENIWLMLHVNLKQIPNLSDHLSFTKKAY